jgi:hypothetical protein
LTIARYYNAPGNGRLSAATARTCDEQIPRIFPGNAVHVAAMFCDELRNRQSAKIKKACNFWGYQWWAL